jgi:hypothetical protein
MTYVIEKLAVRLKTPAELQESGWEYLLNLHYWKHKDTTVVFVSGMFDYHGEVVMVNVEGENDYILHVEGTVDRTWRIDKRMISEILLAEDYPEYYL